MDLSPKEAREALRERMHELGVTFAFVYSPIENAQTIPRKELGLRWTYTLVVRGEAKQSDTFTMGIAHCPSYDQREGTSWSVDYDKTIRSEVATGKSYKGYRKPIPNPDPVEVFRCLLDEAQTLDHPGFESWAREFGYDTDSRKAEKIYHSCLRTALVLRASFGDAVVQELRELGMQL